MTRGKGGHGKGHSVHGGHDGGEGGHGMDAAFIWKLSKLGRIGSSRLRFDDDFTDRLNYQITGVIMFLFIGLLAIRQYVGKQIQCWIPQEFTRGWEEYAENYCWISNTYFVPVTNKLPLTPNRQAAMIGYYQWAPIFLAIQALFFYVPCLMWRMMMGYSGFNVRCILQMASESNVLIPESTAKNVRSIARYIDNCIYRQRDLRRSFALRIRRCFTKCSCLCCGRRYGNYLILLYFGIKFCYLFNVVAQLYLIDRFIGSNYTLLGLRVLIDLAYGKEWYHSGNFPRVTFCDFEAKKLGKNQLYTLQCVLPLNMFIEKIFIFLWFWLIILGLATFISIISWFIRMAFSRRRLRFIRKYLKIMNLLKDTDKTTSRKFVENYLRSDGVFLIRLVSANLGDILAGDLTCELWNIYRHKRLQELEDVRFSEVDCRLGGPEFGMNNTSSHHGLDKHSINNNNNNNNDDSIV